MSPRSPHHVTPLPIPISTITRGLAFRSPRALGTVPPADQEETLRVRHLPAVHRLVTIAVVVGAALAVAGVIALL